MIRTHHSRNNHTLLDQQPTRATLLFPEPRYKRTLHQCLHSMYRVTSPVEGISHLATTGLWQPIAIERSTPDSHDNFSFVLNPESICSRTLCLGRRVVATESSVKWWLAVQFPNSQTRPRRPLSSFGCYFRWGFSSSALCRSAVLVVWNPQSHSFPLLAHTFIPLNRHVDYIASKSTRIQPLHHVIHDTD